MTMPELPELEILRRDLDKEIAGRKVKTVEAPSPATIKRAGTKKQFISRLEGAKLERVERRGTWLVVGLDTGESLLISLGAKSRVQRVQNKEPLVKGTAVIITFTQHGQLRIVDPAKSCHVLVAGAEEIAGIVEIAGLDMLDEPVSWQRFGEMLLRRKGRLKSILMDPSLLVGIGPVYSDEILFEAGLKYDRSPDTLSAQEIRRLYRAVVEIVHDAVKHGGATTGPEGFLTLSGERGGYTDFINVFGREGQMSPRARGPIVKTKFGSGYTYYCEQTQV